MIDQRALTLMAVCSLALSSASAQSPVYDFSTVTQLASGAVTGQTVPEPVPGFELVLMKDGRIVYRGVFGTWAFDRVAAADSATKTISGAVVMSIIDSSRGAIGLDTRLSELIPQFTGDKATITIRQAFSHTSGLPGNSGVEGNPNITLQQAALLVAAGPLPFGPPGSTFAYGGTSMHAAGAAIEVAAGQPWNAIFQQRIADPLGLVRTRYVLTTPSNPRIAGGCESTALEFATFMDALRRARDGATTILTPASAEAMFTRQTPVGVPIAFTPLSSPYTDGADYGVGVWLPVRDANGVLKGAIAAGARGFSAWIDFQTRSTGVLATDLTRTENTQPLLYELIEAASAAFQQPICPANCDGSTTTPVLNALDFSCFLTRFRLAQVITPPQQIAAQANCDGSTVPPVLNALDFSCFLTRFNAGCP